MTHDGKGGVTGTDNSQMCRVQLSYNQGQVFVLHFKYIFYCLCLVRAYFGRTDVTLSDSLGCCKEVSVLGNQESALFPNLAKFVGVWRQVWC